MARQKVTIKGKTKSNGTAPEPEPARKAGPEQPRERSWLEISGDLAEQARDVWIAGLGAVSVAEEAGKKAYGSLLARGEEWERDSKLAVFKKMKGGEGERPAPASSDEAAKIVAAAVREAVLPLQNEVARLSALIERLLATAPEDPSSYEGTSLPEGTSSESELPQTIDHQAATPPPAEPPAEVVLRVSKTDAGWVLLDDSRATEESVFSTKAGALAAAKDAATGLEKATLIVERVDGSEQSRTSYP